MRRQSEKKMWRLARREQKNEAGLDVRPNMYSLQRCERHVVFEHLANCSRASIADADVANAGQWS